MMKFHIVFEDGEGWMWWLGQDGGWGPVAVSMGWYRSKSDCIGEIKRMKQFLPTATIDDPTPKKPPPFSAPRLRPEHL